MVTELHNIPKANTEGKHTNVIIEHGFARAVFHRIGSSDLVQISITPNIEREMKQYNIMLTLEEINTVFENLDLEEIEFDEE